MDEKRKRKSLGWGGQGLFRMIWRLTTNNMTWFSTKVLVLIKVILYRHVCNALPIFIAPPPCTCSLLTVMSPWMSMYLSPLPPRRSECC